MFTSRDLNIYRKGAAGSVQPELESIKRIYAGYSTVYDIIFKRFFQPRIKHAIDEMDIRPGERVLDVGVGTGLSLPLFPRHARVVGIDLSQAMLAKAKKKIKELSLDHASVLSTDAMNLCFDDNSFDKVFISHVVSVVPDPYRLMAEVKRVCKKDGSVVLVNHFKSKNRAVESFERLINPVCKKIGWHNDLCMDEFLGRSGLLVKKRYMLRKLDFWHIILASNEK